MSKSEIFADAVHPRMELAVGDSLILEGEQLPIGELDRADADRTRSGAVPYTHLTLPTIYSV